KQQFSGGRYVRLEVEPIRSSLSVRSGLWMQMMQTLTSNHQLTGENMKRTGILLITVAIAIAATSMAAFAAKNPIVGGKEMFPRKNIIENAVNSADHTTLVAAVKAAGLV